MCVCVAEQWLQFDIGPPTLVTGVVTKGRGDGRKKHWVTEYRLSYSNDSRLWHFYKDEPLQDIKARLLRLLILLIYVKHLIEAGSSIEAGCHLMTLL